MTGYRVLAIGGAIALLLAPEFASAQGVSDLTGRRVGRCDIARELGGPLPPECGGRPGATGAAEGTRGRLVIQNPGQAVPQQDRTATTSAPAGASAAPSGVTSGSAAATAPEPAPRAQAGRSVALTVLFELNSATLTAGARQQLDELAAVIKAANPTDRFAIEGHTDARGGDELNQELSERRAAVAVEYLVQRHGISADRLEARAYGRSRPLVPADPFDGRNRRVQVTIIGS
jgi:outer membrane protein OmpA-like peptidoglycan-associated protein